VVGDLLIEQPERMGQLLGGQDLQLAVDRPSGQVRGALAAPIEDQDAGGRPRRCQVGGGGVGDVVGHVAHAGRVEAGQGGAQEHRRPLGVQGAQPLPPVGGEVVAARRRKARIVGVGDRVEVVRREAACIEAPAGRPLGQLPGGERHRRLAVLAPGEPLLLGRGDDLPVDHQRRRRIVEHSVDAEYSH
jgi:hypothetical protein